MEDEPPPWRPHYQGHDQHDEEEELEKETEMIDDVQDDLRQNHDGESGPDKEYHQVKVRDHGRLKQQRIDWPITGRSTRAIGQEANEGGGEEQQPLAKEGRQRMVDDARFEVRDDRDKGKDKYASSSEDIQIQQQQYYTSSDVDEMVEQGGIHIHISDDIGNEGEGDFGVHHGEEESGNSDEYEEGEDSDGFNRTDSIGMLFGGIFSSGDSSLASSISSIARGGRGGSCSSAPISPRGKNARRKKASDYEENIKARHLWYEQSSILISHLFMNWGERMWELAIPLLLVYIFPHTLLPAAIVGVCQALPAVLLAGTVINWVYNANRMLAIILAIGMQLLSMLASAAAIGVFLFVLPPHEPGTAALISSWKNIVCFVGLSGSQCFGSIGWIMYSTSVGGDWVPTLFSSDQLSFVNMRMGFIELFCRVCAPGAVGALFYALGEKTGFLVVAPWSLAGCIPAFLFLRWVYRSKTLLAFRQKSFEVLQGNASEKIFTLGLTSSSSSFPDIGTTGTANSSHFTSLAPSLNDSRINITQNTEQTEEDGTGDSVEHNADQTRSPGISASGTTIPTTGTTNSSYENRRFLGSSDEMSFYLIKSRPRRILEAIFSPVITLFNAYRLLVVQQVNLVIFAHTFLWMSVLSSSGLLLSVYLKARGYSDLEIALFRCVGALLSVASIFSFPVIERRLGLVLATRIYLMIHGVFIIISAAMFSFSCCIFPYFLDISSVNYISRIMVYVFMVLVVLASFGYYGYFTSEAQVIKMAIPEEIRGTITILDTSLTRLGLLVIYVFALFLSQPYRFVYLVAGSAVAGNIGVCIFLFWSRSKSNVNFLMLREFVDDENETDSEQNTDDTDHDQIFDTSESYARSGSMGSDSSSIDGRLDNSLSVNSYPGESSFLDRKHKSHPTLRPHSYAEPSMLSLGLASHTRPDRLSIHKSHQPK